MTHRHRDDWGFGELFGACGPGGFAWGFGGPRGGAKRRRSQMFESGEIKFVILRLLKEKPRHGYEIIKALEERMGGHYTPSAGTVYPTLQLLEDSGLATSELREGKRVYSITDEGRAEAERRVSEAGRLPWEQGAQDGGLRGAMMQLQMAARQINAEGDPDHVEAAIAVVNDARKQLYRLLAD